MLVPESLWHKGESGSCHRVRPPLAGRIRVSSDLAVSGRETALPPGSYTPSPVRQPSRAQMMFFAIHSTRSGQSLTAPCAPTTTGRVPADSPPVAQGQALQPAGQYAGLASGSGTGGNREERQAQGHRAATGAQRFVCPWEGCPKTFAQKKSLTTHRHHHTGEKPFACPYAQCSKKFVSTRNIRAHLCIHTGERPFACPNEHCLKAFTSSTTLAVHFRRCTGLKPWQCSFPGCLRSFTTREEAAVHLRRHTGEKPFVCLHEGCGKRFAQRSSRVKHWLRSHDTPSLAPRARQARRPPAATSSVFQRRRAFAVTAWRRSTITGRSIFPGSTTPVTAASTEPADTAGRRPQDLVVSTDFDPWCLFSPDSESSTLPLPDWPQQELPASQIPPALPPGDDQEAWLQWLSFPDPGHQNPGSP